MIPATGVDLYQLTSLVPHWDAGLAHTPVTLCFFSRRLPKHTHTQKPARAWLLQAGLHRALDYLEQARFTEDDLTGLLAHPIIGPPLQRRAGLIAALREWHFTGSARAPLNGTALFAGPALRPSGDRLSVYDVAPAAYCPYLVVHTDLLTAKLIETPLLSYFNHMTMVATKASRVVQAAEKAGAGRTVLEFGTRRTHPEAAIDAAAAAYIGGCTATSNVRAHLELGIPMAGTMDHFAIQAWEQSGVPRHITETAYFRAFSEAFPGREVLLVDTYDTLGEHTGVRAAVAATQGGPWGIRVDSQINRDNLFKVRALLDSLGATHTKIVVSGGMDEHSIAALGDAPIDSYGVGERIVTSPDAPVGVGAVAKLSMVGGQPTMKIARGTSKSTLPGELQVWRQTGRDVVGLEHEQHDGTPLLVPVWSRNEGRLVATDLPADRARARTSIAALSATQRSLGTAGVMVTQELCQLVERLVTHAVESP